MTTTLMFFFTHHDDTITLIRSGGRRAGRTEARLEWSGGRRRAPWSARARQVRRGITGQNAHDRRCARGRERRCAAARREHQRPSSDLNAPMVGEPGALIDTTSPHFDAADHDDRQAPRPRCRHGRSDVVTCAAGRFDHKKDGHAHARSWTNGAALGRRRGASNTTIRAERGDQKMLYSVPLVRAPIGVIFLGIQRRRVEI